MFHVDSSKKTINHKDVTIGQSQRLKQAARYMHAGNDIFYSTGKSLSVNAEQPELSPMNTARRDSTVSGVGWLEGSGGVRVSSSSAAV